MSEFETWRKPYDDELRADKEIPEWVLNLAHDSAKAGWIEATRQAQELGPCGIHSILYYQEHQHILGICYSGHDKDADCGIQGLECSACIHEKEVVKQAVAVTVERCANALDPITCPDALSRCALLDAESRIRFLSPDLCYIERERLKARLSQLEGLPIYKLSSEKIAVGVSERIADLERQLAELGKPEGDK